MSNINLNKARIAKNDEFYTQYKDIEKELQHYTKHFIDKIVYCNCDDPEWSNFWKYFKNNFHNLQLKKLISTHYNKGEASYKLEYDGVNTVKTSLIGDGDFRSDECIQILKEVDIVVTNPPFSLFRSYVAQLVEYGKDFIVIGSQNAITYKEVFPLLKDNKLSLGINAVKEFTRPDGKIQRFGNICWFSTFNDIKNTKLNLIKKYNPIDYPKYDGYDIINVNKVKDIPYDYTGVMGVPITFLDKYNPDDFTILGIANSERYLFYECSTVINGKNTYQRILIKRKLDA